MKRKQFIKLTGTTGTFIALGGPSLLLPGCSKESSLTDQEMEQLAREAKDLDQSIGMRGGVPEVNRFAVLHDGTEAYFPSGDGLAIQKVSLLTGQVAAAVIIGAPTTGVAISRDGTSLATTQGGTVTPVIIEPLSTQTPIVTSVDLQLPTFSPSVGGEICLIGTDDHSVTPGDWDSKILGTPMPLPHQPKGIDHAALPDKVGITIPKENGIVLNGGHVIPVGPRVEWITATIPSFGRPLPGPEPIPHPEEPIPSSFLVTSKKTDKVYIVDAISETVTGSVDLNQPKMLASGPYYTIVLNEDNKVALIDIDPTSLDYATIVKRFILPVAHEAVAAARDTNRGVILLEGRDWLFQIDPASLILDGGTVDLDLADLTPIAP